IVESLLMERPEDVGKMLHLLKGRGVSIYLDDFGTGFSSFSYLSRFPLDVIKIDAAFVGRIGRTEKDDSIVISMIELARNLDMRTIAEGVESARQLEFLRAHACDGIQGYYYGKPMP